MPDHVLATQSRNNIRTQHVSRMVERSNSATFRQRTMPDTFTEAPSFFNNLQASQQAKSLIDSFTRSYLSNVSISNLGDSDASRIKT